MRRPLVATATSERMKSNISLTLILAMCTMMGALGIDTYLPSFHAIGDEFSVGPAAVQQTLSVYVLSMAITMLFYGSLSDTFGRRRVLMFSAVGYALTSFAAAFVNSIEAMVAMRCAQGAMAGAGMVIARAVVQDRFQGADAQRMMSMVMFCFGLAPAIAPVFGGWLQAHGGWRSTFFFLSAFGVALALLCWRALPETLPSTQRVPLKLSVIAGNYLTALGNAQFRWMVLGLALMTAGTAIYISSAAEFILGILKLSETSFGWLFIPLIGGSMVGSAISGVLAKRIPARVQKMIGYGCLALGCSSNVLYHAFTSMPVVPWAVLPVAFYTLGIALLMPILSLQIMGMFPQMRGLASSLQGFTQMSVFALMAGAIVPLLFHSGLALAVGQCVTVGCGMAVWWHSTRLQATKSS